MRYQFALRASASLWALGMASTATAQDTAPAAIPQQAEAAEGEIVVVGVRQSLEKAATIKREALQVVDSIVADDIGKFPDPTTAAALQRVPGVQVQVGANNEIVNVRIRGLDDILSTLNGREIFSTTGRGFALQDLPAVALARVDVIKSSTANLIEGGIAGITDLQLNRPFNFNEPTIVAMVRGNYSQNVEKLNPQVGLLLSDRWDTGIGEIGALVGMSYAYFDYDRPVSFVGERRSYATQFGLPGVMGPLNFGAISNYGNYRRPQANASVQWQATPELQVYADGLFTGYRSEFQSVYQATPFFNPETRISDVVVDQDKCILARVGPNQGNPTAAQLAAGNYTVQNLCNLESATFTNVRLNSSTQARTQQVDNYLGAIGFKYDNGVTKIDFDAAYQKSMSDYSQVIVDVGKRITVMLDTDQNGGGAVEQPGNPAADPNGFFLRNGLNEQFDQSRGELWQARVDATHDLEGRLGFLDSLQVGLRFADRSALFQSALVTRGAPGGDLATPVAGNLPAGFLVSKPGVDRANGGAEGLAPDPDFLRSEYGRSVLRTLYGLSPGQPAFQDDRRFEATERTYASYVQLGYKATLGGPIEIDGLVGVRPTKTERTIQGAGLVNGVAVPQSADTSDVDVLPNASARIQFGGGLQARFSYAKAIRRPEFSSLNPGLTYVLTTNPNERNSGSGGNPDLRPQISDSYDATLEYYFGSSFVAVAGFYRDIKDRVVTQAQDETLDGTLFSIRRPRNIGTAQLKGVEISGQTFFDFLPGPLAGFGAFGNFTYIDSEIGGDDVLRGLPILQVSKYNFNTGLLYDRNGISARLVYTYRSRYYDGDATGSNTLRDFDESNIDDRNVNPTVLTYVRPAGRLDFSVGYDLNEMLRVDIGGSNILRNKYKSYYNSKYMNVDFRDDDSVYTVGLRAKF